jgi:hypothetical protein
MTRPAPLVLILALAGCGGGAAPATPSTQTAAVADTAEAPAAAAAAKAPAPRARPQRPPLPDSAVPVEYQRELFRYTGGSRDPFESLIQANRVGPMIEDLRVVSITYDARYGNSVAIVRAAHDPRPLRLRRGDVVGNLRVIQIRQNEVVFQITEYGLERQAVLTLRRPEVSP